MSTIKDFTEFGLEGVCFRLPKNPNAYGGWTGMAYDQNRQPILVASPCDLSLPFAPDKGGLTAYEELEVIDDPQSQGTVIDMNTPFFNFIREFCKLCRASFEDTRRHFRSAGDPKWGEENMEMFEIAQHKMTPHGDMRTYKSNKYSFKAFQKTAVENGKAVTRYEIDVKDSFNCNTELKPGTGQRGQMLLHLHSWYYDSKLKKLSVRVYVKAVSLSEQTNTKQDIRSFFESKEHPWLPTKGDKQ